MATEQGGKDISVEAGADLSAAGQYRFVTMANDGQVDITSSAGGVALGILQDASVATAAGKICKVRVEGCSKLKVAATITADDKIQSDASGEGIVAASGDHVLAQALEGGASGDIIEVLLISQHILA